jgi:DNA helicase II / ATP-dependent DNA helicase PcrA
MMNKPALARLERERFDHVLVDEYQDTNALQAQIL